MKLTLWRFPGATGIFNFYQHAKWEVYCFINSKIICRIPNLVYFIQGKREPWIHQVGDGRGFRDVYVDGVKLEGATYANIRTGEVRYHGKVPQLTPDRQSVVEHTAHGKVEIKWLEPSSSV